MGGRIGGGGGEVQNFDIGIAVKRRQIEQNFELTGIWKSSVGFGLAQLLTP